MRKGRGRTREIPRKAVGDDWRSAIAVTSAFFSMVMAAATWICVLFAGASVQEMHSSPLYYFLFIPFVYLGGRLVDSTFGGRLLSLVMGVGPVLALLAVGVEFSVMGYFRAVTLIFCALTLVIALVGIVAKHGSLLEGKGPSA